MNDSSRRSDLFRRMRRQRSSTMRFDIAVVALPRLDEKSLSRTSCIRLVQESIFEDGSGSATCACSGWVPMNNPG
ncbi:MAG TPA: hypothetical protein VKE50_10065 [Thermoanaerobaculia bacterium]|nr:hypothetical protein [Thermoanaerobaculia bacterium]